MNESEEVEKITKLAGIASHTLPRHEIRGVFRIVEDTPAGQKCSYIEDKIGIIPVEFLYGGIIIASPERDKTRGKVNLEISTRDYTIRVMPNSPSGDALNLKRAYESEGYRFEIKI